MPVLTDPNAQEHGVSVVFTGCGGGVSRGRFATLNLGGRVGDDPAAVEQNRRRSAAALGVLPEALVFIRQVHGASGREVPHRGAGRGEALVGDFLVGRAPGVAPVIVTADCVPVVLQGARGIAVVHAGWRGIVGGVVEAALETLDDAQRAWMGPSIRGCCYEVGPEVAEAFSDRDLPVAGDGRVDPADAVLTILERAGIEEVAFSGVCTHDDPGYFSARRDGRTGRQGALASLLDA